MSDTKAGKAGEKFPLPVELREFPRSATLLDHVYDETDRIIRETEAKDRISEIHRAGQ
jgi:hypothetical protein